MRDDVAREDLALQASQSHQAGGETPADQRIPRADIEASGLAVKPDMPQLPENSAVQGAYKVAQAGAALPPPAGNGPVTTIQPNAAGVVILPAGAKIAVIQASGGDLRIVLEDGSVFVVAGGVANPPSIQIGAEVLPGASLTAVFGPFQEVQPAAGEALPPAGSLGFTTASTTIDQAFQFSGLLDRGPIDFSSRGSGNEINGGGGGGSGGAAADDGSAIGMPTADSLAVSGDEDSMLTAALNGADSDGTIAGYIIKTLPASGTLWLNSDGTGPIVQGQIVYGPVYFQPNADWNGDTSFEYTAVDDTGNESANATVTLDVNSINDVPTAESVSASGDEDTILTVVFDGADSDGTVAGYIVKSLPADGTLWLNANGTGAVVLGQQVSGTIYFQPDADWNGNSSFDYAAIDNEGGESANATVSLNVAPVNEVPTAESVSASGDEDTILTVSFDGADIDGTVVGYIVKTLPANGTLWLNADGTGAVVLGQQVSSTIYFEPNADWNGNSSFEYAAIDNEGAESANATVTLDVNSINDVPTAENVSASGDEDAILTVVFDGADSDGTVAGYIVKSLPANGTLWLNADGTGAVVLGQQVSGTIYFRPDADWNGNSSFDYAAIDNEGAESANATVTLDVNSINDVPTAESVSASGDEDTILTVTLDGADSDGTVVGFIVKTLPANGTLWLNNDGTGAVALGQQVSGTIYFEPNADWNGNSSFEYAAIDNEGAESANATATLDVNSINDAPTAENVSVSGNEDTTLTITFDGADIDGTVAGYIVKSLPTNGTLWLNANGTGAIAQGQQVSGTIYFRPAANWNGNSSFDYTAIDNEGAESAQATISLNVAPVNDQPTITSGLQYPSLSEVEDNATGENVTVHTRSGTVFFADADIGDTHTASYALFTFGYNGAPLSAADRAAIEAGFSIGALDQNAGSIGWTYTVSDAALDILADQTTVVLNFRIYVEDSGGLSTFSNVRIDISGKNDAPIITSSDSFDVAENTTAVGAVTSTDVDIGATKIYSISGGADASKFSIDSSTGALTFKTAPNFENPTDANGDNAYQVRVTVWDTVDVDTQDITVRVTNVNETPAAQNGAFGVSEDGTLAGSVLATDPDSNPLTYSLVDPVDGLVFNSDGTFTFTPGAAFQYLNEGESAQVTFQYEATDGALTSNSATVTITVEGANENAAPTAENVTASGNEDALITITLDGDDADGNLDGFIIKSLPANGTLYRDSGETQALAIGDQVDAGQNVYFRPAANFSGEVEFNYTAIDAQGAESAPATASIDVSPVADAPSFQLVGNTDDKLYFSAFTSANGYELWSFDGTTSQLVADINSGPGNSFAGRFGFVSFNGKLYFNATGGAGGSELWSYDGTTAELINVNPTNSSFAGEYGGLIAFNGKLYFNATGGAGGSELWSYDGTSAELVADINSGPVSSNAGYLGFTEFNGKLYFGAFSSASGYELWSYDGTTAELAADINSGPGGSEAGYYGIVEYDGKLYFAALNAASGYELWSFDGTTAQLVADINPDGGSSFAGQTGEFIVFNGKLYFTANDGTNGHELYSYDGTTVALAANINTGPASSHAGRYGGFTEFNGKIYFSATNGTNGYELWSFDGTDAELVANIVPDSESSDAAQYSGLTVFNGKLYFSATTPASGYELWSYDGVNPPQLASDIVQGALSSNAGRGNGQSKKTFFVFGEGNLVAAGDEGEAVTLPAINASLTDTDGSEELTIALSGYPAGATFSAGAFDVGSGKWLITNAAEIAALGSTPLTMTPPANWNGTFTLTVEATVTDTATLSSGDVTDTHTETATVEVTINPGNEAPTAENVTASGDEDALITITLDGDDADGDLDGFIIKSLPANGTLWLNDNRTGVVAEGQQVSGTLYFEPNADWNGNTSFTYAAIDSNDVESALATVSIEVDPVNDAPVITSANSFTVAENIRLVGAVTSTDIDGGPRTYRISGGTDAARFSMDDENLGTFSFVSWPNFESPSDADADNVYNIEVEANDGQGGITTQAITITVTNVNEAPNVATIVAGTLQGVPLSTAFSVSDQDNDPVTVEILTPLPNGVTVSGLNISYTPQPEDYALDSGETRSFSFDYRAFDGVLYSITKTASFTIYGLNDAPVAQDASFNVSEDGVLAGAVVATDVDIEALTYSLVNPVDGLVFNADGTFTYTPGAGYQDLEEGETAQVTFQYSANDGTASGNIATATITINGATDNVAPVAENVSASGNEDALITVTLDGDDADGNLEGFIIKSLPANGTLYRDSGETQALAIGDQVDAGQNVYFRPDANFSGEVEFNYTAIDAQGEESAPATVTLDVSPVADAPSFQLVGNTGDKLYFMASTSDSGAELWSFDGTTSQRVTDINPGSGDSFAGLNGGFVSLNGKLYFNATGAGGSELWSYDGTTAELIDVNPSNSSFAGQEGGLIAFNGNLYFSAYTGDSGFELWKYDGTNAELVADINQVNGSSYAGARGFIEFNGKLYFSATNGTSGYELWSYDGTTAELAANISPDPGGSDAGYYGLVEYDGKLYFSAYDAASGYELWSFDGSTAQLAANIRPSSDWSSAGRLGEFIVFNGKLYFSANDGTSGFELWSYDGTAAALAANINSSSASSEAGRYGGFTEFNGKIYFSATNGTNGYELWSFDGTDAELVADIVPNSGSSNAAQYSGLTVFNGKLYFNAQTTANGSELWSYDGVNAPQLASDIVSGLGSSFAGLGNGQSKKTFFVFGEGNLVAAGDEGEAVTLPAINASLTDTDGSETLTIALSGFPAGATFSVGAFDAGSGKWLITNAAEVAALGVTPLTMTPPANWNGTFTLTVEATVIDTAELSSGTVTDTHTEIATVEVTINPGNEAPTAENVSASGNEDALITVTLDGDDADGNLEGFIIQSLPANGTLYRDSGETQALAIGDQVDAGENVYFRPAANFSGEVEFSYTAIDAQGEESAQATASIDVSPVADVPTLTIVENAPLTGEILVNTSVNGNQYDSVVAALPGGNYVVAWGDDSTVRFQRMSPDGTKLGGETVATTPVIGPKSNLSVEALADGSFAVVWQTGTRVVGAVVDASGVQTASIDAGVGSSPKLTVSPDGQGFAVAFKGANGVYVQRYTAGGAEDGSRIDIAVGSQLDTPDIAALPDGGYVVTYSDKSLNPDNIFVTILNEDGSERVPAFSPDETTSFNQILAQATVLASGNILISWAHENLRTQVFAPDGTALSPIRTASGFFGASSSVHALPDGGYLVAYTSTGANEDVFVRRYDESGVQIGNAFRLNGTSSGTQRLSAFVGGELPLALLEDGSLVAVWHSNHQAGQGFDVYSRVFNIGIGFEDQQITLPGIVAAVTDTDGSETLVLALSGFPAGATFSVGSLDAGSGKWLITDPVQIAALDTTPLTMTPPANWNGRFTLTVEATVTDTNGVQTDTHVQTRTVDITVGEVNDIPVANAVSVSGNEDTTLTVNLSGSDVEGAVNFVIKTLPANGTLWLNANGTGAIAVNQQVTGPVYFKPDANFSGEVEFNYTAIDAEGAESAQAAATIDVSPIADAPTLQIVGVGAGKLFFNARDAANGGELWSFDGTTAQRVTNIHDGANSSNAGQSAIYEYNGKLYFSANDGINGSELWSYDGSTVKLEADIHPSLGSSAGEFGFIEYDGKLFFSANGGTGSELWSYDGTTATLEAEINSGGNSSPGHRGFAVYNGKLYFGATNGTIGGDELWSFDGTSATMVAEIQSGLTGSQPGNFKEYNGKLYFSAYTDASGYELWSFDGTTVQLAANINANAASSFAGNESGFTEYNGKLYFSAQSGTSGFEIWSFDGTTAVMAAEIRSGSNSSSAGDTGGFTEFNGKLYFCATSGPANYELWSFDGTNAVQVGEINAGPFGSFAGRAGFAVYDGKLYFSAAADGMNFELWSYDGINAPQLAADINNSPTSSNAGMGPMVVFGAGGPVGGYEDTEITLPAINASLTDTDGSETLTIALSGYPAGATFSVGAFDAGSGKWLITNAAEIADLDTTQLTMTPPANWNGTFTMTVEAITTDTATLSTGTVTDTHTETATFDVTIDPLANTLVGGPGADTFLFTSLAVTDMIQDYSGTDGDGDLIDLSSLFQSDNPVGEGIVSHVGNELRIDLDGAGPGGYEVAATFAANPAANTISILYTDTSNQQQTMVI